MKKIDYIRVDGVDQGIDFDAAFQVRGHRGIAFRLLGWRANQVPVMCLCSDDDGNEWEEESGEFDTEPDYSTVVGVMVGDDRHWND